jgi:hypothetical protein
MTREKLIDPPLCISELRTISILDRMNRWMGFVIVLTLLGWLPLLARSDFARKLSEVFVLFQTVDDCAQVDGGVIPGRLRAWVTQETFVVKLLHVLHGLLRRDAQLSRNQLLRFNSIQREWLVLQRFLFGYVCDLGDLRFLGFFEEHHAGKLVEETVALPDKVRHFRCILSIGVLQLDRPELLGHELSDQSISLNDEAKRGKLARTVANDTFPVWNVVAEG